MAEREIRIDLGAVDYDSLQSEADFRREASRHLPKLLTELGEAQGELAWTEMQRAFRGSGFKPNNSSSDKRKFIREAGENYRRNAGAAEQTRIVDHIVAQLKAQSGKEDSPMPISFNEKEQAVLRFLKKVYLEVGGRPTHLSGPGGTTKAAIVQECSLDEMEFREIMGRFEHFGFAQRIAERVNINDAILEAVRSLDDKPAPPQATVSNTINIGTAHNSPIQQGSHGATQHVTISTQDRANVEKILEAVGKLIGQLARISHHAEG